MSRWLRRPARSTSRCRRWVAAASEAQSQRAPNLELKPTAPSSLVSGSRSAPQLNSGALGRANDFGMIRVTVVIAFAVVACDKGQAAQKPPPLTCGVEATPVLTSDGIGALKLGSSVEAIRSACVVVRDTIEQGAEGMPERRLGVLLGQDTVQATVDRGTVRRIEVRTPRIRTDDSLGVGSTLETLRRQPAQFLGYGEGGPFMQVTKHCGLTFDLTERRGPKRKYEQMSAGETVERVLVVRCHN